MVGTGGCKTAGIYHYICKEDGAYEVAEIDEGPVADYRAEAVVAACPGWNEQGIVAGEELGAEGDDEYEADGKHAAAQKFLQGGVCGCDFGKTVADDE